jgi:ADP-ribosylglycohydrolase
MSSMLKRGDLAKDADLRYDKAFGALIGLAIGDSFGDQARSPENHILYGISRDLYATSSWSTDDTEFALLDAQILIETGGDLTTEAVVEGWKKHVLPQSDLGPKGGESEIAAAENLRKGIMPPYSGSDNSHHWTDGAAMRIAPIGVVCAGDPERAARLAEFDACVSHYRDGIWGAQAVAASIAVAMVDGTVDEIVQAGLNFIPEDSWLGRWMAKAMDIADKAGTLEKAWDSLHCDLWTFVRCSNAEALSQTYAIFRLTKGDFVDGIIYGGNFGRDADTVAALVGAMSGARNGAKVIPTDWIKKTRHPAGRCLAFTAGLDIADVAQELAKLIDG